MTREEAIERLEDMDNVYNQLSDEDKEALDMAIDALEDNQWQKGYDTAMENANKTKESLAEMCDKWIKLCQVQQKLIDDLMSKNEKMRKALEVIR